MANRSRMVVVGCVILASGLGAGATMIGCSDDDTTLPPDASVDVKPDTTADVVIDVTPDVTDGGPDVSDAPYDPKPIYDFMDAQVTNICTRYSQCCFGNDASAFDTAKCRDTLKNGYEFNLRPLLEAPLTVTDGKLKLDTTAANACLAEVLTFSCPSAQATETSKTTDDCFSAIRGTAANGQPCNQNIECANGICTPNAPDAGSDAGTGTCTGPLSSGQGPCGLRNEECQIRGHLGPNPLRCDVQKTADGGPAPLVCSPLLANGTTKCTYNWECQSGVCDFVTQKCQASNVTITPAICNFLTIKDAGGGG